MRDGFTAAAADATRDQTVFREVNERVRAVAREGVRVEYLCECADRRCSRGIVLATDEYDGIRRFPTRFFLVSGHHSSDEERIVEWSERFAVVEKYGESGKIAVRLDPRRRRLLDDLTGSGEGPASA